MAVIWLYGLGLAIIFLHYLAKIHRVKMIEAAGRCMQRKTIGLSDVAYIMVFLLAIEFTILISWQLIAPLKWVRDFTIDDIEGYTTVSVGGCNYEESEYFYGILVAFHVICLFYALGTSVIGCILFCGYDCLEVLLDIQCLLPCQQHIVFSDKTHKF